MMTLTKSLMYIVLLMLAYGCVQTANSLTESSCQCARLSLILVIIGCTAVATSIFYSCSAFYLLLSLIPLIGGFALWLIVSDAYMHHRLDKIITYIKIVFIERIRGF